MRKRAGKLEQGMICRVEVFDNQIMVGTGYLLYYSNGTHEPLFVDHNGKRLDEGWYQIHPIEAPIPVSFSLRIH